MNSLLITSLQAIHRSPFVNALVVKGQAAAYAELAVRLTTAGTRQSETVQAAAGGGWTARFALAEGAASPDSYFQAGVPVGVQVEALAGDTGAVRWTGRLPGADTSAGEASTRPSSKARQTTIRVPPEDLTVAEEPTALHRAPLDGMPTTEYEPDGSGRPSPAPPRHDGWKQVPRCSCPVIHFEHAQIGPANAEGHHAVTLEATVKHPLRNPVEAQLRSRKTGEVLAAKRSEAGWATLRFTREYAPGAYEIDAHVTDPAYCPPASTTFEVTERGGAVRATGTDAQEATAAEDDHSEDGYPESAGSAESDETTAGMIEALREEVRDAVAGRRLGADSDYGKAREGKQLVGEGIREAANVAQESERQTHRTAREVGGKAFEAVESVAAAADGQDRNGHRNGHRDGHRNDRQGRGESQVDTFPDIHFSPADVGSPDAGGERAVTLEAVVKHPYRDPVEAKLVDDQNGEVLVSERSERGRLKLRHTRDYTPGEYAVTVEVETPSGFPGTSASFVVPEPEEEEAAGEEQQEEEDGGLGTALFGAAWAVTVVLFLLAIASGSAPPLIGVGSALLVGVAGPFLGFHPQRWAVWTWRGLGGYALVVIALLPYTSILRMDGDLLATGLAAVGFAFAAGVVYSWS